MLYLDSTERTCPNGLTGFELVGLMHAAMANFNHAKFSKATSLHTGPATRAKVLVKKWKFGFRPTQAPERGHKFISAAEGTGYGASKKPYLDGAIINVINKQDKKRRDRLPGELMHRVLCLTNFNEFDNDLALPGCTETQIVSVAATRALGYAPLIVPDKHTPIMLDCKYHMGDRADMAIELE